VPVAGADSDGPRPTGGVLEEEQDKLLWSTPKLTEVTGSDEAQAIAKGGSMTEPLGGDRVRAPARKSKGLIGAGRGRRLRWPRPRARPRPLGVLHLCGWEALATVAANGD
jgi:hypothetical protein